MNSSRTRKHSPRERGSALLAAIALSGITAMMVGAGLWIALGNYDLSWSENKAEAALLLAEGGINDELATIAANFSSQTAAGASSAPTIGTGETMTFPGENHAVYGRKGTLDTVSGGTYWVCATNNEWWKSGATPVAWDGVTTPFWITSTAYVNGAWRRVESQASTLSIFAEYAVYATAYYNNNSNALGQSAANVTVTGTAGTNGQVQVANGSSFVATNLINANTDFQGSGQFQTDNLAPGGKIFSQGAPFNYPTTATLLKRIKGLSGMTDAQAWSWLTTNKQNVSKVYRYKTTATSATISSGNCQAVTSVGLTLTNANWSAANAKPGTSGGVKTLIFEPGDYLFNTVQLNYDPSVEIVIDPQALASGGTPGQVRFWIYDAANKNNDNIDLPITMTKASSLTVPDAGLFRVYAAKDGKSFTFNRPSNIKDYLGNSITSNFNVYGCVYAVTRQPGTTTTGQGTQINLQGANGSGPGTIVLNGSLLADKVSFQGPCNVIFQKSNPAGDLPSGAGLSGGYYDGF